MIKKEIIAMLLAGGQGTRLKDLTKYNAKPAVPFGGKYRIIDFTLSNCTHSGIDTVGILTQYQPLILGNHIGIGSPWDLDRMNGGVTILPPHVNQSGMNWYNGTADAIYQNISFVDYYDPEYIIVLSGDHIYKMDYSDMLNYHKEKKADATIAVIEVPLEEANRFGIMNTAENNAIVEFEEKPKEPKNNMASMGIYIFNWKLIKEFLKEDKNNPSSSNDFGKNIIPALLRKEKKLFAYPFEGYWKDVGTIESYWEANMDLLKENNQLNLYDKSWKIYSNNSTLPPQYIGNDVKVENSLISDGCVVLGDVLNSILFPGVYVGKNSRIINSVILPNVIVEDNVIVDRAIIGNNSIIRKNNIVANSNEIVLIGEEEEIGANL
ncbi:glucose-1-phosphate adenylyltransferase [Clostridium scatologenes]|nr:glucose-1-phosphate adenylyltransferase [Clostridium scatologenes]